MHQTPTSIACRYMAADAGSSSPPENTLEAMGPVLESVLGSLTQEYEKRLFSKDHEVKGAQVRTFGYSAILGLLS